jgi:regulatory protein
MLADSITYFSKLNSRFIIGKLMVKRDGLIRRSDLMSLLDSERNQHLLMAKDYAVRLLAKRDYSEYELSHKIIQRLQKNGGTSAEAVAAEVCTWLCELDYLNDRRFCERYVRAAISKGQAEIRIRHELRQRRVAETLVDEVLAETDIEWLDIAQEVLARKFKQPLTEPKAKAKAIRLLQYRGFSGDQVYTALDHFNQLTENQ